MSVLTSPKDASGILASDFSKLSDKLCAKVDDPKTDKAVPVNYKQEVIEGFVGDKQDGKTSIELQWVPEKRSNECQLDCKKAFDSVKESCGKAGAHVVANIPFPGIEMSNAAEINVGCGTYKYTVIAPKKPAAPKPSSSPPPPAKKDPVKTCYKADANRMKDHHAWKFMEQSKLDEAVEAFCKGDWGNDVSSDKDFSKSKSYFDGADDWNTVKISVTGNAKNRALKGECERNFYEINAGCDWDGLPADKSSNQFK
jgi:hypothetical protein